MRSWLINNNQALRPNLLTIYHNDTPHPSCIHNANTMKICNSQGCADFASKMFGKYVGKSKEQNAGKIGGKLEKWAPRNGNLT